MRRCGHNPTDIEVADIINKIHDESGGVSFQVSQETGCLFHLSLLHLFGDKLHPWKLYLHSLVHVGPFVQFEQDVFHLPYCLV